jgi:hypothetical protein
MSDELKRWSEDAPEQYRQAKSAYAGLAPRAERLEEMLARVEQAVQLPVAPPKAWLSAKSWLWLVPVLGLLGVALFFTQRATRKELVVPAAVAREQALRAAPVPSASALAIPVQPESTTAVEVRESDKTSLPTAPRRTSSLAPSDPLAELALLDRARRVMATNPARALALSEQHRQSYRSGQFAEERELLAIEALVRLHQPEAAERRARAFSRAHPNSVHAHRLEVILQQEAP